MVEATAAAADITAAAADITVVAADITAGVHNTAGAADITVVRPAVEQPFLTPRRHTTVPRRATSQRLGWRVPSLVPAERDGPERIPTSGPPVREPPIPA